VTKKLELIEIPEFPILHGEKAIKALQDYIRELEEQKNEELTDKQAKAMIQLAQGLISTIETETRTVSRKKPRESRFVEQFKKAIIRHIPESVVSQQNFRL
jgi:hypothetical protein